MYGFLSIQLRSFSDIRSENLRVFPPGPNGDSSFANKRAVETLIFLVQDGLREFFEFAGTSTGKTEEGTSYLRYGLGRRLRDMFYAYRNFIGIVYPDRAKPLKDDEVGEASRDLNLLYTHLVGTLDNVAWFMLHEMHPERLVNTPKSRIGLFQSTFLQAPDFNQVASEIEGLKPWWKTIQDKRDPSAHRIPLSVARSIVNPDEARRYQELNDQAVEGFRSLDLEKIGRSFDAMNTVGKFVPLFLHHPREGAINVFPTVPEDIRIMLKLAQICLVHWRDRHGEAQPR